MQEAKNNICRVKEDENNRKVREAMIGRVLKYIRKEVLTKKINNSISETLGKIKIKRSNFSTDMS